MTDERLYYVDIEEEPMIAKDKKSAIIALAEYMLRRPEIFIDCCTEYLEEE